MVTDGGARHSHVFYEPSRLALVPFSVVFLGSDALKLLVTHWVRSPPDDGGARIDRGSGVAARRGGVDLATVEALVRECVGRDASRDLLPRFREQVGAMASLVTQPAPSAGALAVSSVRTRTRSDRAPHTRSPTALTPLLPLQAHLDVAVLSHIFCDFLHAFKLYAADSTRAVGHEGLEPGCDAHTQPAYIHRSHPAPPATGGPRGRGGEAREDERAPPAAPPPTGAAEADVHAAGGRTEPRDKQQLVT